MMDEHWQHRIEKLEEEVKSLKAEISKMKQVQSNKQMEKVIDEQSPKTSKSILDTRKKPVVKPQVKESEYQKAPKKTFEEQLIGILPKVFMLIFVLGVLWGLKLMSDYGMLGNQMKVLLAYCTSIAIGALALFLEKKGKSSRTIHLALYSGSFTIGILATAAAVLIYDVMTTTVALWIALVYIGYGIALCIRKGNEGLTIFVMFTSLLLPYLLEYMSFNALVIVGFIVLLYVAIQYAIIKHRQYIALYVTTLFVGLSIFILYEMSEVTSETYAYGAFVAIITFFVSWIFMKKEEKRLTLHCNLLYSYGIAGITALQVFEQLTVDKMILFFFMTVFLVGTVLWEKKRGIHYAVDIFAALVIISVINMILASKMDDDWRLILLFISGTIGFILAIRLEAKTMKITNIALLFLTALFVFLLQNVYQPMKILTHIIAILSMVICIFYNERTTKQVKISLQKIIWPDIVRIVTYIFILIFVIKLENEYTLETLGEYYLTYTFIALSSIVALVAPLKIVRSTLPMVLFGLLIICTLLVWLSTNISQPLLVQMATRFIYLAIWMALLLDVYYKGAIYQRYKKWLALYYEKLLIGGWLIILLNLWSFAHFLYSTSEIERYMLIIITTGLLFALSVIFIFQGRKNGWQLMLKSGFTLLMLAIGKLILADLSNLDLSIRAIVFITIGALGLVLSNRLLKKL